MDLIEPYMGVDRTVDSNPTRAFSPLWDCPDHPSQGLGYNGVGALYRNDVELSYVVNGMMAYNAPAPSSCAQFPRTADVMHPSQKVLYCEFNYPSFPPGLEMASAQWIMQPPAYGYGFIGHRNGMNVLFCDYHVEWCSATGPVIGPWTSANEYAYWYPCYP